MVRIALIAGILLFALTGTAGAHGLETTHTDTVFQLRHVDIAEAVEASNGGEGASGLPTQWCGTRRESDDTANAVFGSSAPQFKVIYAYPSDRADRSADWADVLQANVSLIGRFMGGQSGGRKTPRFDMGTSCGAQYVDIQVVPLPNVREYYRDNMNRLVAAVQPALGNTGSRPRNAMVFADTLSGEPVNSLYGLGSYRPYSTPTGTANPNNAGGAFATLWVPDGQPTPGADPYGWWPEGMLHEITHNLGAVQEDATHATANGHCYDGYDVMCYDDGGLGSHSFTYPCAALQDDVWQQRYDCGGDDYFNVNPPAGSYLATHFNTYDNVFLAKCATVAPACGATATDTLRPPVSSTPPEVVGTALVDSPLRAMTGSWANSPSTYAYQWERGDGVTWTPISGATGVTYVPRVGDVAQRLRVRVTATNDDGSAAAASAATAVVNGDSISPIPGGGATVTPRPAARRPKGRAALKVAVGRGKGKRLGTIAFRVAGGKLRSSRTKIKLARGRYELALCTTAGTTVYAPRCAKRRVTVKRGSIKLPALAVRMPAGVEGRATYSVTAVGRLFAARTAKRPRLGVSLRG